MIDSNSFVPGRIYSLKYSGPVDMVGERDLLTVGKIMGKRDAAKLPGQDGKKLNPFAGKLVTVKSIKRIQAAGTKTYANRMRSIDPEWEPSSKAKWYEVDSKNSCILVHKKDSTRRYLRALPISTVSEYYIDGKEATPEQTETIKAFKRDLEDETPVYLTLSLDKLPNVQDDGGTAE